MKIDPFGIEVAHTWAECGLILETLVKHGIGQFVELGVWKGGLASLVMTHANLNPHFRYLGVEYDKDITDPSVLLALMDHPRMSLWITSALMAQTVTRVWSWLAGFPGTVMIYCDDGDKSVEFGLYAPILRPGDFIAAHDYDYGGYERAEITDAHIGPVAEKHNLVKIGFEAPYRIALFRKES